MTYDEFLSQVSARAGLANPEEASRTIRAVLEAVGARLGRREIEALDEDLPARLAAMLRDVEHGQDFGLAELHARVARSEHLRPGFAVEHTGVVCQVLAEALSPAALHRLRESLPEPLSALFTPREPVEHFEYVHLAPGRHTLAEGRPGSQHPVSEGRPGSQHPVSEARAERAHSHSVVREANPHGDTKLSSASGLTQEREHETLAEGRPLTRREEEGGD